MGKTGRTLRAVPRSVAPAQTQVRGPSVGTIVSFEDGSWNVAVAVAAGAVRARTTLALDASAMQQAAEQRREALIVFEGDDLERPIVVGLIAPPPAVPASAPEGAKPVEAIVDGKRVVLDARDEIVLRCGPASITLRRNGRVVIRGTYVETRSAGTNRIKGGNVQIN